MKDLTDRGRHRVLGRVAVVVSVGVATWLVFDAFATARDAADSSCLASLHERLQRSDFLTKTPASAEWEAWSGPRIQEALARIGTVDDCDPSLDARWKRDLRIRSRQGDGSRELGLWLANRPGVFSGAVSTER